MGVWDFERFRKKREEECCFIRRSLGNIETFKSREVRSEGSSAEPRYCCLRHQELHVDLMCVVRSPCCFDCAEQHVLDQSGSCRWQPKRWIR